MSFKKWFNENLKDSANDILNYGADQGYPHITYYYDTTPLYDKYSKDILDMLQDSAIDLGYNNTLEILSCFARQDMLSGFYDTMTHDDQSKCLLVWFACEELARLEEK